MDDPLLSHDTAYAKRPNKFKRFAIILIVIGLLLVILFAIFHFVLGKNSGTTTVKPTPTDYQFPSDTPVASATASITVSVTPSGKGTVTPSPKTTAKPTVIPSPTVTKSATTGTTLDRSTLTVNVENGSGAVGAGSKGSTTLKNLGYNVTTVGNADNFNYTNVTIQVKSTKSNYLSLLKSDLSGTYTIGSATADLPATATTDAVVIIGK